MVRVSHPLVYTIALDPLMARAVSADLPCALFRTCRSLRRDARTRRWPRPDLVLLDLSVTAVADELATARAVWGDRPVIVGVGRSRPFAYIWSGPGRPQVTEVGPGFLAPYLPDVKVICSIAPGRQRAGSGRKMGDAGTGHPPLA